MNFGSGILLLASLPKSGEIRSSRGGRGLRRTSIYIVDEELWRWVKYFRAELEGYPSIGHYIFQLIKMDYKRDLIDREFRDLETGEPLLSPPRPLRIEALEELERRR